MAEAKLDLCQATGGNYVATLTPPQSGPNGITIGKGAYCFVIDVSGSMNAAAQITTDDGDKVNHGWSQLDIAKHSTNTFVSSLEDGDYFSVVTYSDGANVLLDWTECNQAGRDRATSAIHSMRPERSTNLMAGITSGCDQFKKFVGVAGTDALDQYALNLVITTDGMPSSQWHPARGRDGYFPLVKQLKKQLKAVHPAAAPTITTIGIGFQLDSDLLLKMSSAFLHMPDPGQIGPFIVNLLAAVRATSRLPSPQGSAANDCQMVLSPAEAFEPQPAPGYDFERGPEGIKVALGAVLYDQPRHLLLKPKSGSAFTVKIAIGGTIIPVDSLTASSDAASAPSAETDKMAAIEDLRTKAILAMHAALAKGTAQSPTEEVAAPLTAFLAEARASSVAAEEVVMALCSTVEKECIMGCDMATNFPRWGNHYLRTLPCMLKEERRSNFRDEALQHFGKDLYGQDGLFEDQSNAAEMRFATLKPPEPSLLRPQAPPPMATTPGSYGVPAPMQAAAPPRVMALPDEFMRGGGCFGPSATVRRVAADGEAHVVSVSQVRAGDTLVGEGGRLTRVLCVVMHECAGGRALLTRLPNGTELTEWHPVRDGRGCWRFPHMLGERVLVSTSHVYNFVLSPGHPTVLVGGVPCAALGHGLEGPVIGHPYWGTRAVLQDLMANEGWVDGRVVVPAAAHA